LNHNIALISPAGGGKDFIADYLCNHYGFTRYAFADNVKAVAKQWFPDIYGNENKKPRALLQSIGTDFREIDGDIWIKALFKNMDDEAHERKKLRYTTEHIVVTDCRMPNEYEALRNRGFTFIRIDVNEDERLKRLVERGDVFSQTDLTHQTERHYDEFHCDYSLSNHGSKESAYESADEILEMIMKVGTV
jgi:dephospho-CoA kinase